MRSESLTPAATTGAGPWPAVAALVVGYFMIVLDMTVVAVANPAIAADLGADVSDVVWASSAYLLTFAALLLVAGRLGDRFGPKNVYLVGLALFTAASLWCGASPTIGMLIAARAVQGVGAALVTPQTMAVITRTFPPERRSAAMSLWGAVAGLGNLVGPLLGGVLVDGPGWEWIFYVNVPVGVLGFALAMRLVPALPAHGHSFDVPGVVLSAGGIFLLVFGLQEGNGRHWDGWIRAVVAAGLAVLAVFVVHQARRAGEPLLPLGVFRDRNFALATVAVAAAAGAVAAVLVPLYFYLEAVRGLSGTRAALLLAPMAVLAIVFVPVVGRFGDRLHPRVVPTAGFALFTAALVLFGASMTPAAPVGLFVALSALAGLGNACIWPALAVAATRGLAADRAGAGAGAYNAVRQVGAVLGSAAIGAVVASRMSAHGVAEGAAGAQAVPEPVREAFGSALSESMVLPVSFLAVGLAVSVLLRRGAPVAAGE